MHPLAAEVVVLDGFSAHADQAGLVEFADAVRQRGKLRQVILVHGEPPAQLGAESAEFWREVRRLPRRQAQAVALFYLEETSVAEIAEVLGCAESTVKVHLHRGRQALAKRLHAEES